MDTRKVETAEAASPSRQRPGPMWGMPGSALVVGFLVAAAVLALSPGLRAYLFGGRTRLVPLTVRSAPEGADVFIDDQPVGPTPLTAHVAAGSHHVRVVCKGRRPWHEVVDPVSTPELVVTLPPVMLGTLAISSEPSGAVVFLDDERLGIAPVEAHGVEPGAHTILIVKEPLYQPVTRRIELKDGETRQITVRLQSSVERMHKERIKQEPRKLSSYTELLRLQALRGEGEKAVATISQAVEAYAAAEASPAEVAQFFDEVSKVVRGQAGALSAPGREKLLALLAAFLDRAALARPADRMRYGPVVGILLQAGRFEQVYNACQKSLGNPASQGLVHHYAGTVCLHRGESAHAIRLLEQAVELQPALLSARLSLASAYHHAQRLDDALRQYAEAEKLAPQASPYDQGLLQTELARLMVSRKDIEGAIACYRKAIAVNAPPSYTCLWRLRLAQLLVEQGRRQEAIEQYREAARALPDSEPGMAARKALQRLGEK